MSRLQPHHETPVLSSSSDPLTPQPHHHHHHHHHPYNYPNLHHSGTNVFGLLAQREISPKTNHLPKKQWGEFLKKSGHDSFGFKVDEARDAKRGLISWAEAESLWNLSADYCPLVPPPRSTIAAAFSPDGRTIASTHGDHTVKIIDSRSGRCLKVLSGHKRTPWVVRFHPIHPEIVASGSLDHEVRLWDANTSECLGFHDFHRPIASIAFHATGEFLAVASGHKLYMWHYNRRGETSSPTPLLKTRRSLRAVHFHPHGAPFLLTAEVNDIDSSDSSMTRATSLSYLHYPPPAVLWTHAYSSGSLSLATEQSLMSSPFLLLPSIARDESRMDTPSSSLLGSSQMPAESSATPQIQADLSVVEQHDHMEIAPIVPSDSYPTTIITEVNITHNGMESSFYEPTVDPMETSEMLSATRIHQRYLTGSSTALLGISSQLPSRSESVERGQHRQFLPSRDPILWELPFLQGWLLGQSQAGMPSMVSAGGGASEISSSYPGVGLTRLTTSSLSTNNSGDPDGSTLMPGHIDLSAPRRPGSGVHFQQSRPSPVSDYNQGYSSLHTHRDMDDGQPIINRMQSELANSLAAAAAAAAELPCTVKLKIWSHDIRNACAYLSDDKCRLTIHHAVLCSEMGAHFSPCGRFLAACVACIFPHSETESGLQTQHHDVTGASATSPTRHHTSAHQVMYELRIYSVEEATFGSVLVSRPIKAAHCLTSIQFSPTSDHILLSYGRRHGSLLKSIVIDGETALPIYTILEVYRVSDMEIMRVIPSAEDEVNVACFHPLAGGGLVYGTKEGKLRILQYDSRINSAGSRSFIDENMPEVQTYALEC